MAIEFQEFPYAACALTGSWNPVAQEGSRNGYVVESTQNGDVIAVQNKTATDFYLMVVPVNGQSCRFQVNVDGVDTRIIDIHGRYPWTGSTAKEIVDIIPSAPGLSNTPHTVTWTKLDNVTCRIEGVDAKSGYLPVTTDEIADNGDSISEIGQSNINSDGYLTPGGPYQGWFLQLCAAESKTPRKIGQSAATLPQIIRHLWDQSKTWSTIPYLHTMMAGHNDLNYELQYGSPLVTNEEYVRRKWGAFFEVLWSLNPDVFVRMAGITTRYDGSSNPILRGDAQAIVYNGFVSAIAAEQDDRVAYVEVHSGDLTQIGSDQLHPNLAGHNYLYGQFVAAMPDAPLITLDAVTTPTDQPTQTVTGTVAGQDVTVTVNGVEATITGGTWSATVPLTPGSNTITATATNGLGSDTAASAVEFVYTPEETVIPKYFFATDEGLVPVELFRKEEAGSVQVELLERTETGWR